MVRNRVAHVIPTYSPEKPKNMKKILLAEISVARVSYTHENLVTKQ